MFKSVMQKIRFQQLLAENASNKEVQNKNNKNDKEIKKMELSGDISKDVYAIKSSLGNSSDIILREFNTNYFENNKGFIIYIDALTDKDSIERSILKPVLENSIPTQDSDYINDIKRIILPAGSIEETSNICSIIDKCLVGDLIILLEGYNKALIVNNQKYETRNIEESKAETVVRGPREGFTEVLSKNIGLLRRKIHSRHLIFEVLNIGNETKTDIAIVYLQNAVYKGLVEEVKRRLKRINIDSILESGYVEQFIEDAPYSVFSTVANSEKPDVIAAKILEGRVAIIVDGTPIVLSVPMLFVESFQVPEDYYSRPYYVSLVRALRYISFLISLTAPSFYVALTTFHQELIPEALLLSMIQSREGTPFPTVFEAFSMTIIYEILREAGIRLPRAIGQAISIVGALVIGQAAVTAGLIGAPMVIVVSITAIASFAVPPQTDSVTISRLMLIILSGIIGLYGVTIGLLYILIHLCSLKSFGVPYLSPIVPLDIKGMEDTYIRSPLKRMTMRHLVGDDSCEK